MLVVKPLLRAVLLLSLAVSAVAQNTSHKGETVSVSVSHLVSSAGERVVSFEIEVTAGTVQAASNLPIGWYVVVDNDASWRTKVKGNTTVGAAALSADDFQKIRLTVKKDEAYLKFALSGMVSVTKDFQKERRVALKMDDFAMNGSE